MQLHTAGAWAEITAAARAATLPADIAVAYFGSAGPDLLPLPIGSNLVVDATQATLQGGATNPFALQVLHNRGVNVFSFARLHAKAFAFDAIAFVGSTNASARSRDVLVEAAGEFRSRRDVVAVRTFVRSLCINRISDSDFPTLQRLYRPPKPPRPSAFSEEPLSTLIMELTLESRITQVQPPLPIWEHFFGIRFGQSPVPRLRLLSEHNPGEGFVARHVSAHDHTLTVEIPEAHLPRPAILRVRRVGKNRYRYEVHRPGSPMFATLRNILDSDENPLRTHGRLWSVA